MLFIEISSALTLFVLENNQNFKMSPLVTSLWNVLQNYSSFVSGEQGVIIEQVEPPSNFQVNPSLSFLVGNSGNQ